MLTGENGILSQAQNAKRETENAQEEEQNILTGYENYINSATNQVLDDDLPGNEDLKTFITQWSVADGETIVLPIYEKQEPDEVLDEEREVYFNYNFTVDYGDGTVAEITSFDDEDRNHTYQIAGTYDVKITGMCEGWSFYNVGDSASNLTEIKQWGVTQAKYIDFGNCINLSGQIPVPVKNSFTTVESFRLLFYGCTNLKSEIPENLFYNATNVITLRNAFNISGITGTIPENLLSYCTKVENVAFLFDKSNITGTIPENLFSNCSNLKSVMGIFEETSITGSIPEKLFYNCPNIINASQIFWGCTGLTGTIPENLFANNPNMIAFYSTFNECTGLTGAIPENLFINQAQINNIDSCFMNCTGLSDSQIRIVSQNLTETNHFCEGVNAKITVYVPKGIADYFSESSNVTVVEYDI